MKNLNEISWKEFTNYVLKNENNLVGDFITTKKALNNYLQHIKMENLNCKQDKDLIKLLDNFKDITDRNRIFTHYNLLFFEDTYYIIY